MINIGILGAQGRMGQSVLQIGKLNFSEQCNLFSQPHRDTHFGRLLEMDVVLDFSSPQAMEALALTALKGHEKIPAFVVGSTGWKDQNLVLEKLSLRTPVLLSANFSTGLYALKSILKDYVKILEKLEYSAVLVERHHQHKKDAPSGTAHSLLREFTHPIPTHSIRAGETIGIHEVTFYGQADSLSLTHFAQDRSIFSRGALQVCLWLAHQDRFSAGLLGMSHYFDDLLKGI